MQRHSTPYFRGREKPADEWEENESVIYRTLSQYQKDGYHAALQIADTWNGALICDGVGSGKTYIGLMLLERYLRDNKRVLLITPKSVAEKRLGTVKSVVNSDQNMVACFGNITI